MQRVVVVGGGVIGLCTAFYLQRAGADVVVVSAGPLGTGASAVNAGWIVPSLSAPVPTPGLVRTSLRWMLRSDSPLYIRPRADLDLVRWLLTFWRRCNPKDHLAGTEATAELNRQTMGLFDDLRGAGVSFEYHKQGLLFAYESSSELEHDLRALEPLRAFGLDLPSPLWKDALHEFEPSLTDAINGGYWISGERHVRPDTLTTGLAEFLSGRVQFKPNQPVLAIEHANGRATAIRTAREKIEADAVVICAGAWAGRVARLAGVRLPMEGGKGYKLDYSPPPTTVNHALYLHERRVAVTPLNGMIRLAGTMEFSGLNDLIRPARVAAIARAGVASLRDWPADPAVAQIGSGLRPMTPDGLPIIGWLPGFHNLAVASGHAMLGVTLGPATGSAIANLVTTGQTSAEIAPFNPARFGAR